MDHQREHEQEREQRDSAAGIESLQIRHMFSLLVVKMDANGVDREPRMPPLGDVPRPRHAGRHRASPEKMTKLVDEERGNPPRLAWNRFGLRIGRRSPLSVLPWASNTRPFGRRPPRAVHARLAVCWSGSPPPRNDARRSARHAARSSSFAVLGGGPPGPPALRQPAACKHGSRRRPAADPRSSPAHARHRARRRLSAHPPRGKLCAAEIRTSTGWISHQHEQRASVVVPGHRSAAVRRA